MDHSANVCVCMCVCIYVRDENGNVCNSPTDQGRTWHRHFSKVYNVPTSYEPATVATIEQQEVCEDLADPPTLEELRQAVRRLRNGKAAGGSGILPELLKAGGDGLMMALLDLVQTVWNAERVPQEWGDCQLVPIPKKGNLSSCDNWRGIALLEVVGWPSTRLLYGPSIVQYSHVGSIPAVAA